MRIGVIFRVSEGEGWGEETAIVAFEDAVAVDLVGVGCRDRSGEDTRGAGCFRESGGVVIEGDGKSVLCCSIDVFVGVSDGEVQ